MLFILALYVELSRPMPPEYHSFGILTTLLPPPEHSTGYHRDLDLVRSSVLSEIG